MQQIAWDCITTDWSLSAFVLTSAKSTKGTLLMIAIMNASFKFNEWQ